MFDVPSYIIGLVMGIALGSVTTVAYHAWAKLQRITREHKGKTRGV